MIQINGLTKSYGEKVVFSELTFSVEENVCTVFSGESGIGKTTLLRCISGLEKPDSGTVTGLSGKKLSFIFQENRLIPGISALDNILCVTPDKERAAYCLERAGLADAAKKKAGELSGGMQRRLSAARALAYGGDVFFFDEPLRELDPDNEERMLRFIKEETAGRTVLLITHEKRHADFLAKNTLSFHGFPMRLRQETDQ